MSDPEYVQIPLTPHECEGYLKALDLAEQSVVLSWAAQLRSKQESEEPVTTTRQKHVALLNLFDDLRLVAQEALERHQERKEESDVPGEDAEAPAVPEEPAGE